MLPLLSAALLLAQASATITEQAPAHAPSPAVGVGPTQSAAAEQLGQAEARYRAALAVSPDIAAYHESLALVLERQGRVSEALASHARAVQLDSLAARNRTGLGLLLLRVGRTDDAIAQLRAAAAIDPTALEVRAALGAALLKGGRRDEALAVLREARQLDSGDSDIERSIKQAEATAPGKDRLNDGTALVDHPTGRAIRRALEWIFGIILTLASLALLVPLGSGVVLALLRLPQRDSRSMA